MPETASVSSSLMRPSEVDCNGFPKPFDAVYVTSMTSPSITSVSTHRSSSSSIISSLFARTSKIGRISEISGLDSSIMEVEFGLPSSFSLGAAFTPRCRCMYRSSHHYGHRSTKRSGYFVRCVGWTNDHHSAMRFDQLLDLVHCHHSMKRQGQVARCV